MNDSAYLLDPVKKQRRYSLRAALRWIYHHFPGRLRDGIAVLLVYECREKSTDTRLIKALKRSANVILLYSLLVLRVFQRYYSDSPYYPFEDEIVLTTTRVIFTRSKRSGARICLKLWQRTAKEVCDDQLIVRSDEYLLEGLEFNKKFAPHIYLGIASVIIHDDKKIQRGSLIWNPRKEQLPGGKNGERNALVMRTLESHQRLDRQLNDRKVDVAFLAREVARMQHIAYKPSNENAYRVYGTPASIASKLELNIGFFLEAVNRLYPGGRDRYKSICSALERSCEVFAPLFVARYQEGHIKRRHGDLKATNLWVRRVIFPFPRRRLRALDCIDFNPALCYIDTLSDVAMLAVDLERLTLSELPERKATIDLEYLNPPILPEQKLAYSFLLTYLNEMQESFAEVEPLLEYYMTEKAAVCAYVSILFDVHNYDLGKQYLQIACVHAQRLDECIRRAQPTAAAHSS